jgi:hypothetical protein
VPAAAKSCLADLHSSRPCWYVCSPVPAEVLADMEQPELGIVVPHLQYWTNDGEFTQVRAAGSMLATLLLLLYCGCRCC